AEPHVVAAALYDGNGRQFSRYPADLPREALPATPDRDGYRFEGGYVIVFEPVAEAGNPRLGTLYLQSDMKAVSRTVRLSAAIAYSVSHDLRAPLRSIDGFSQVLLEDYAARLDDAGRDSLHRVRAASQRMGMLIDDLLKLARVTRAELHAGIVDLSAMAQDVATELQRSAPERRVEFVIAPGITARGDVRLLRVVLDNLLGNSWKYTAKQPRPRIEFSGHAENGEPVYAVRDNGAGFDM